MFFMMLCLFFYCILRVRCSYMCFYFLLSCSLETTLRNFSCLSTGDSIMVAYNNKKYYIDIIETKPASAISIIETDCEVDFAPPLDYKEPEKPVASFPVGKSAAQGQYFSFCFTMSFWYCCGFFYTLMESECATCFSRVICHTK